MKERYVYMRFEGSPRGKERKKARGEAKKSKGGALFAVATLGNLFRVFLRKYKLYNLIYF